MQQLEEIHESYQEDELVIEGEFASDATMIEWGWSELLAFWQLNLPQQSHDGLTGPCDHMCS